MTNYTQFSTKNLPEWQLEIIRKYPDIYTVPNPHILAHYQGYENNLDKDNFCNLRYGFEFNSGWAALVDKFSQTATELIHEIRPLHPEVYIRGFIFKQKFGRLTWQGDSKLPTPFNTLFRTYVASIEEQSVSICERTGTPGELRNINHYLVTLCQEEYDKALAKEQKHVQEPEPKFPE